MPMVLYSFLVEKARQRFVFFSLKRKSNLYVFQFKKQVHTSSLCSCQQETVWFFLVRGRGCFCVQMRMAFGQRVAKEQNYQTTVVQEEAGLQW